MLGMVYEQYIQDNHGLSITWYMYNTCTWEYIGVIAVVPQPVARLANGYNVLHFNWLLISVRTSHFSHCSVYSLLLQRASIKKYSPKQLYTKYFEFGEPLLLYMNMYSTFVFISTNSLAYSLPSPTDGYWLCRYSNIDTTSPVLSTRTLVINSSRAVNIHRWGWTL